MYTRFYLARIFAISTFEGDYVLDGTSLLKELVPFRCLSFALCMLSRDVEVI